MSSSPYAPASKILNQIWTQHKGLKTVVYSSKGELTCSKATYAQCSNVLQHKPLLDQLLNDQQAELLEAAKNIGLLYVLLYELLLGPNLAIRGGGSLKRLLLSHHERLLVKLEDWQIENPEEDVSKRTTIPRYMRINTLQTSTKEVIEELQALQKEGTKVELYMDPHVPDLLVLPPTSVTRSILQNLVTSHKVILQDKSSCFSALCLVHGFDSYSPNKKGGVCDYLDACAAPGNKTSHLAALISSSKNSSNKNNCTSIIHGLDQSPDRFQLLQRRMNELTTGGTTKVQCHHRDFLKTTPKDFNTNNKSNKIQAILLDPSCSGSGMITNHSEIKNRDPTFSNDRIDSLSQFQCLALKHALTNFPNVQRVVYSTCSLYIKENEGVVQRGLKDADDWELVAPQCLATWKRRGIADDGSTDGLTPEQAKCLIRVHPDEDATNGFFVACFQRKSTKPAAAKSSNSSASWKDLKLPEGLEFYNGQFQSDTKKKFTPATNNNKEKKSTTKTLKEDPKATKKDNSSTKSQEKSSSSKKRKGDDSLPTTTTNASKKRDKKMEWKRKQRVRKFERLQQKTEES